jgi:uncharacterized membrane protein YqjE
MATEQRTVGVERGDGRLATPPVVEREPPLGDLFRHLADDTTHLIRQEMNLAKVEMRQMGAAAARDAAQVGIAIGLGVVGALAMAAFLIVALGDLLGNYWLSALLVSVLFLVISGVLAKRVVSHFRERGLKPEQTIETLREDKEWAQREARDFKRDLRA